MRQFGFMDNGTNSFEISLLRCFEAPSETEFTWQHRKQINAFARTIAEHEIEVPEGVAKTLPSLADRHTVILVTKGNAAEQQDKLDRSGIHEHFQAVEVPAEKDEAAS